MRNTGNQNIFFWCMPGIVKRIASCQHKVLPGYEWYSQFLVWIEYPYGFHRIVEHCTVRKSDRYRIAEVNIFQHLKVIAVPMTVDDANAFFAGISGGLKPTRRLIERFIVNADRYGYVRSEDRQREGLPVNRRGMRSGRGLRSRFCNRGIRYNRTGYRRRGVRRVGFARVDSLAGTVAGIGRCGNGIVGRFTGLRCLRGKRDRLVNRFGSSSGKEADCENKRDKRDECYKQHDKSFVLHKFSFHNEICAHRVFRWARVV